MFRLGPGVQQELSECEMILWLLCAVSRAFATLSPRTSHHFQAVWAVVTHTHHALFSTVSACLCPKLSGPQGYPPFTRTHEHPVLRDLPLLCPPADMGCLVFPVTRCSVTPCPSVCRVLGTRTCSRAMGLADAEPALLEGDNRPVPGEITTEF